MSHTPGILSFSSKSLCGKWPHELVRRMQLRCGRDERLLTFITGWSPRLRRNQLPKRLPTFTGASS